MRLSKTLNEFCKEHKLSIAQLAKKTNVPKATIHGWMTGRKAMDLDQLRKVALLLQISLHELVFGEPDPYEGKQDEILKEIFSGDVRVTLHRIEKAKTTNKR